MFPFEAARPASCAVDYNTLLSFIHEIVPLIEDCDCDFAKGMP